MSPIGVVFNQQDSEGLFHFQKFRALAGFRCLNVEHRGSPFAERHRPDALQKLIDQPDVSLIWLGAAATPAEFHAVLQAGKHVLCGLPIQFGASEWRALDDHSVRGSRVFVAACHRWDSRFATALAQVTSGELGTLLELHRISRQFVPGELSLQHDGGHSATLESSIPDQSAIAERRGHDMKWFELLDELLLLVSSPPVTVQTRARGANRAVWIEFESGARAHVELHRRSLAPLETDWVLEGTRAGYAGGKRYQSADDFELIDVPAKPVPTSQQEFYRALEAAIRSAEAFPISHESVAQVLALRTSIEHSHGTDQAVPLTDH